MLQFGNTEIGYGLVAAPLSGISDSSFRKLCRSYGAELVFSEMISAEGVKRRMERTLRYLHFSDSERPIVIQIFGSNSESMRIAAQVIESTYQPDGIDINLGCPVKKVVRTGAGAALLKDKEKMKEIVAAVVSSVNIPVSAKVRIGWSRDESIEIAKILEECGISFLTVHARRAIDNYGVKGRWSVFEKLKRNIRIPIVANGDINTPQDVRYLLNDIGVSAIMIGRGAIGKPWIFNMIRQYLKGGCIKEPEPSERIGVLLKHIELMSDLLGTERTVRRIKKQIGCYLKGIKDAKQITYSTVRLRELDEMVTYFKDLMRALRQS